MIVEVKGILAWTQFENWKRNVESQVSKKLHQNISFEQIEIIDKKIHRELDDYCLKVTVRVSDVDLSKLTETDYRRYVK